VYVRNTKTNTKYTIYNEVIKMKNYNETIKMMEADGWFRVHETSTHIFFYKRMPHGGFAKTCVEYSK